MSKQKQLIEKIRKYVDEHNPSGGDSEAIEGIKWRFICEQEQCAKLLKTNRYPNPPEGYVFTKQMKISIGQSGEVQNVIFLEDVSISIGVPSKNLL